MHKNNYPIEALKRKLVNSGYSKEEVDRGESIINKEEKKKTGNWGNPINFQSIDSGYSKVVDNKKEDKVKKPEEKLRKKKKGKIMGVAGIIGFVFFILYFLGLLLSFFNLDFSLNILVYLITLSILVIAMIIYYSGFIKMAGVTDSKLLKFSSWATIVFLILSVILIGVGVIFYLSGYSSINYSPLTRKLISSNYGTTYLAEEIISALGILAIVPVLLVLFFIIIRYGFSIGLIKIKDKIRIAGIAGTLNLIFAIILTLVFITLGILIFPILSGSSISSIVNLLYDYSLIIKITVFIINLLIISIFFLEAVTLRHGHKKYE